MYLVKYKRIKMFNKMILAGNLTRDIEMRNTPTGLAISNTGIASNRKFKSKTGENKEEVLFLDITFFGRTAEVAQQYLRKGSKVLVDGRLKLDQWTDANGQKRSKHSLVVESMKMLDSKGTEEDFTSTNYTHRGEGPVQVKTEFTQPDVEMSFNEDDIPLF
jgi:single-strand DNA-binding protein